MTPNLSGKVVLVTGGASGIGHAAARLMASAGARVVVADVDVAGGERTAAEIFRQGNEAVFVPCDVAVAEQVESLVAAAVQTYGRLDCAFNNAGLEGVHASTVDCSEANWDRTLAVNLKGVWLCMRAELRQMLRQRSGGSIVNTASVAGMVAERGHAAYAAAKGGVIQLTRTAAAEYAAARIRINALCPGAVQTPMVDREVKVMRLSAMSPGAYQAPAARFLADAFVRIPGMRGLALRMLQPMGRIGRAEEIAEAAAWLCSDAASFVTGHALVVDGGMTTV
jgi:NAD(P)-dependent dehydrogenase (short-subunit alcohol dehydrogenase family)